MAGILILLVIGLSWLGAIIVWLVGDQRPKAQHWLAFGFSALAGITSLLLLTTIDSRPALDLWFGPAFGSLTFIPDGLAVSLTVIATVIGSLAVLFSMDYMRGEAQLGRYYFLVLFFIGAMAGLVLSGNLLFTFFFWEITALCSYGLISFHNDDPKAVKGGIKALIITQVGGVGLLAGALLAYANLGSFQIADLLAKANMLPAGVLSFIAFAFLIAAAAKSAQFPFHTWLPDAMEAPTPISALIHAATMVNAGIYLLARFQPAFASVPNWNAAVIAVGVTSALITAFMALTATDLKRALAYSTVSQLGYMVYAIGAGGVLASHFHLQSHAVFKALLFLTAGAVIHSVGTRDMRRMGALGRQMPFVRNAFVIGALALIGLPIFNGFWSKELILEVGFEHSPLWVYALMLFAAALTAFYTFRMTWLVFFGAERNSLHAHDAGNAMKASLGILALATFVIWLSFGGFSRLLTASLPFHGLHEESTLHMMETLLSAPLTWFALLIVGLSLTLFFILGRKSALADAPAWWNTLTETSFGFESLNHSVVRGVNFIAEKLRFTQSGELNWNILGIMGGLLAVLLVLWWSGV